MHILAWGFTPLELVPAQAAGHKAEARCNGIEEGLFPVAICHSYTVNLFISIRSGPEVTCL